MSNSAITRVWKYSKAKGSSLVILLALADKANTQDKAWPSTTTLANLARLQKRQTQYALAKLITLGEIEICGYSKHGVHIYHLCLGMEKEALLTKDTSHVHPVAPLKGAVQDQQGRTRLHAQGADFGYPPTPPYKDNPKKTPYESRKEGSDKTQKKATRLAQDWNLPQSWESDILALLKNSPIELPPHWTALQFIAYEAEKFADYWHGISGIRSLKSDWQATFRNWIRKSLEYHAYASKNNRKRPHNQTPLAFGFTAALACELGATNDRQSSMARTHTNNPPPKTRRHNLA